MANAKRQKSSTTKRPGPESIILTRQLKDYCRDILFELAEEYESVLSSYLKYEDAFYAVMDKLDVPKKEQERMLGRIFVLCECNQLPFHTLSPFNQFHMASAPYIWYCLESCPPRGFTPEVVKNLINSFKFAKFTDQLSKETSQQVKGALWNPRIRLNKRSRRSEKRGKLAGIIILIIFLGLIILAGLLSK